MPRPEGYRKALRLMKLAEKFDIPIMLCRYAGCLSGHWGRGAWPVRSDRTQPYEMAQLRVPIICTVIGEGGSGGALAIAVGGAMLVLQYATYSVISPEGCASILWKSADKAADAAETLGITADRLKKLGLIDKIINEPLGGAHRDYPAMMKAVNKALSDSLKQLQSKTVEELMQRRFHRLMTYGKFKEVEIK